MSLLAKLNVEVARRWKGGDLLRCALACAADVLPRDSPRIEFPWYISLLRRAPADALHSWPILRSDIDALATASDQGRAFFIEWREQHSRQLGMQRWPASARIDSLDQAAALIAQTENLHRFVAVAANVLRARPALRGLIEADPFLVLQSSDDWSRLLGLLDWFEAHPHPRCYLREVDAPGIDTKFIEARRGLIVHLLDQALPSTRSAADIGAAGLEAAFGLRSKPRLVRIRLLDERLAPVPGITDISLPIEQLAAWPIPCRRVFITENEINGLSFPMHPQSLVVFGLGYGVEMLTDVPWLRERELHYWGDIDTHGFVMLARLRRRLPNVRSLLMDQRTLLEHRAHWAHEPTQIVDGATCAHLTSAEANLMHALRNQHHGDRIRLEQERIRPHWLRAALAALHE